MQCILNADYGFEYSEEDEPEEDEQIEIENTYYGAKGAITVPCRIDAQVIGRDPMQDVCRQCSCAGGRELRRGP